MMVGQERSLLGEWVPFLLGTRLGDLDAESRGGICKMALSIRKHAIGRFVNWVFPMGHAQRLPNVCPTSAQSSLAQKTP